MDRSNRVSKLLAVGFALSSPLIGLSTPHAAQLSVGTYNIHHGAGGDGVVDLDRIASVIAGLGADIVGTQENDIANSRTEFVHQPNVVADKVSALTGDNWVAVSAPAIDFAGGQYGNAVLYNADVLSLLSFDTVTLPDPDGDGARSAGLGLFSLEGTRFQFATTHLTHRNRASDDNPGSTIHIDSMDIIDGALDPSLPTIVNGDFNAAVQPDLGINADSMAYWASLGFTVDSLIDETTFVGGTAAIDFNTSRSIEGWDVIANDVVADALTDIASDHYPVVTTYEFDSAVIPVPAAVLLLAPALAGLVVCARRKA